MPRPSSDEPTEVELRILRVLWRDGASPARHVHDELQAQKDTNYSTTVKMLSVMLEKGLVLRDDGTRPQLFRPAATQVATQRRLLGRLIQKAYDGSTKSLVMQALSSRMASAADLAA